MKRPTVPGKRGPFVVSRAMRLSAWIGLFAGLTLFCGLIIYQGTGEVLAVVASVGWGLLFVTLFHVGYQTAGAVGWRALFDADGRPPLLLLIRLWWIGNSINTLLPVAQVGGEFARVRMLARHGVPRPIAGATVVVGLTAGVLVILLFSLAGIFVLSSLMGAGGGDLSVSLLTGLSVFGVLVYGFYLAQRSGMFLRLARGLERLGGGGAGFSLAGGAQALDRAIVELYRERGAFLLSCIWRLLARTIAAAEVWLILYFLGHPVDFALAFVLESLGQAIQSAGFAVPGSLGIQEGGFLLLGTLLGLPGEVALGVSLVRRARDLLLGVPGIAAWQFSEGGRLLRDGS